MSGGDPITTLCQDPVYFNAMAESCTCINTADKINQAIQSLVDTHHKDEEKDDRIKLDNKNKNTKLDSVIKSEESQLRMAGFWTNCESHDENMTKCRAGGFDNLYATESGGFGNWWERRNFNHDPKKDLNYHTCMNFLNSNKHYICVYSEAQITSKLSDKRALLVKTATYKPDVYTPTPIDVGGVTNQCCVNSIKLDGNVDARDISQKCTQEVKSRIAGEMEDKGLGTPESPIPPSTINQVSAWFKNKRQDVRTWGTTHPRKAFAVVACVALVLVALAAFGMNYDEIMS
jgi:hypothetical protein